MRFPADIQGCMKDCILALIWPREEIVPFFQPTGASNSEPPMTLSRVVRDGQKEGV